ncbi:hypothetical protein PIB30_115796, partial [Stylosanthes scabra]|nr:hypothetical protein [Stylosanthes scabra]
VSERALRRHGCSAVSATTTSGTICTIAWWKPATIKLCRIPIFGNYLKLTSIACLRG